jgi:hypothetical protein
MWIQRNKKKTTIIAIYARAYCNLQRTQEKQKERDLEI